MYPNDAGWKEETTSKAAAQEIDTETLRELVLDCLALTDLTADECAEMLHKSVLSIRPRFSELRAKGLIVPEGSRRLNKSGKKAIVWSCVN
jgi:predicted ArsR family transcriptional regulator